MTLKYLGDGEFTPAAMVRYAAVISVPCDLAACAYKLSLPSNVIYLRRFLRLLHGKIRAKVAQFPGLIDDNGYEGIRTF